MIYLIVVMCREHNLGVGQVSACHLIRSPNVLEFELNTDANRLKQGEPAAWSEIGESPVTDRSSSIEKCGVKHDLKKRNWRNC